MADVRKSAFLLGASGEVGKALLRLLLETKTFEKVVLVGRRNLDFGSDQLFADVEQRVVDFDKLSEHESAFAGCQVGFCCLGTTRAKSGAEGFYKVDHDYVLESARLSLAAGCKHFNLVTSQAAKASSPFLYMKTKGEVERDVTALGFDRLTIWRPATLLCDRAEARLGELLWVGLLKPVTWLSPTSMTVPTTLLAKAMLQNIKSVAEGDKPTTELYENAKIHSLGNDFSQ